MREGESPLPKAVDGRSRAAAAAPRRDANASADAPAGPWGLSFGNPVEPPRGRTHENASARRSKNESSTARFVATISWLLASTRSRARSPISASTSDGADEQI